MAKFHSWHFRRLILGVSLFIFAGSIYFPKTEPRRPAHFGAIYPAFLMKPGQLVQVRLNLQQKDVTTFEVLPILSWSPSFLQQHANEKVKLQFQLGAGVRLISGNLEQIFDPLKEQASPILVELGQDTDASPIHVVLHYRHQRSGDVAQLSIQKNNQLNYDQVGEEHWSSLSFKQESSTTLKGPTHKGQRFQSPQTHISF